MTELKQNIDYKSIFKNLILVRSYTTLVLSKYSEFLAPRLGNQADTETASR